MAYNGLPIVPNPNLCPGSVYKAYYDCLFLTQTECQAPSSKCSWIPELIQYNFGYDVASDKNLSSGYAWQCGFCLTNQAPILPLNKTLAIVANASDIWGEAGFINFFTSYIVPSTEFQSGS